MRPSHLLCPIDFSEATPVGLRVAIGLAARFGARITLLHVLPALQSPFRVPVDADDLYDQWDREAGERMQEGVGEARAAGVAAQARLMHGAAFHEIATAAREDEVDLIVLPTHSRAGLDRLLYGSVAERVVRTSPVPVLTVPPALELDGEFAPARVMLATDFSAAAEHAFETSVDAAQAFAADLIIGHVFTFEHLAEDGTEWWRPTLTQDQVEESIGAATQRLDKLAERGRRRGLDVTTELGQGSNPAAEILRLADEAAADLLVVAKHGGFLRHLLMGSTAEKLVRSCPMPLLTVPPAEHDPAEGTIPDPVPA